MSAGGHAQRAVETDHLAIEHRVLHDVPDQGGEFLRLAKPLRHGGQIVGAVGVSGGTGEQDQTVVEAAAAGL